MSDAAEPAAGGADHGPSDDELRGMGAHPDWRVRIDAACDPFTPVDVLAELGQDVESAVRDSVATNESTAVDVLRQLAEDRDPGVRASLVRNPRVPDDVASTLCDDPDVLRTTRARVREHAGRRPAAACSRPRARRPCRRRHEPGATEGDDAGAGRRPGTRRSLRSRRQLRVASRRRSAARRRPGPPAAPAAGEARRGPARRPAASRERPRGADQTRRLVDARMETCRRRPPRQVGDLAAELLAPPGPTAGFAPRPALEMLMISLISCPRHRYASSPTTSWRFTRGRRDARASPGTRSWCGSSQSTLDSDTRRL